MPAMPDEKTKFYQQETISEILSNVDGMDANGDNIQVVKQRVENYIADPNVAHEIANVESTQGRDAALRAEQVALREHEHGFTAEQERQMKINDFFVEKYPDAFINLTTTDGISMYATRYLRSGSHTSNHDILLTPDGIFNFAIGGVGHFLMTRYGIETVDSDSLYRAVTEQVTDPTSRSKSRYVTGKDGSELSAFLFPIGIDGETQVDVLHNYIKIVNGLNMDYKKENSRPKFDALTYLQSTH